MNIISKIILPVIVLVIIIYGLYKRVNIYELFLRGAKEGLKTSFNIFPAIVAMIFATNIFLDSGFLLFVINIVKKFFDSVLIPLEIIPMALLRPISGTASLAIMNDIFASFGPDSFIGRLASILQGCTDTTIYVIALYFSSIKISKTKYAIWVGLFADFVGITMAIILTNLFL